MASKCPNCSQEFQTKDLLTAHCNEKHVGSINAKVGGVELSIKPRPDGSFLCLCPYHLDANVYNSVEEMAHHLKFAVKWAHKKTPEHPCAVGHQLVDTTTLRQFGFAVNADHCLLICLACCTAILPKNVGTHLRDAHKSPLPAKTAAALSSICQFFKVEKEKFPNMHKQLTLEAQPIHERLNGFENRYFRVCSKSPPPSTVDDLLAEVDRVLQEGQKRDPAKNLASVDKRNVSPWLRDTRWHELLSGHTISDLCARVVAPTVAEFPNLQATVYLFLESCVALIDVSTVLTLQTLNSPLPSQAITNHPFKRLNGETMKKYAGPIVNLLAMLLRAPYHPLPEDIQKHVEDLRASLPLAERECGLEAVFTLLANLWQRPWVPTQERRISDPTVIYVALSTLQPSGQFQEPKNVTNIIARIEYCMRLTFLKLIHEAPTLEYGIYSNQPWFIEKVESPFNSLRTLQHLATSIAYQTQSLPRVWWDDRKAYASMIYKGDRIQFDQIRSMLSALEEDMADLWEHHILLSTGVKVSYVDLHDDLSNREAGYSFIHDPRNDLFQDRRRLVKAVLSDPDQRVRFINSTTSQWNVHELRQWLSHYARFHLLLLLKSNLTGGSPGRITELTAMQLCNLVTYPLRNLVVFGRHVALLCTYMKTSANSGYDKLIPHSLDAFTSDLLVQDLAIARPFAEFAIRKCHPDSPEIHALFKNHIFINHTRLFTTDDVTTELKRSCIPHLGIEIGVNGWRHISTAFRRVLCPRFTHLLDDDPENESIDALQSGHTRQTENRIYGVSQDALAGASEDVLPLFLDASTDWQLQCSVVPGGLRLSYNEARMSRFEDLVGAGVISPRPVEGSLCKKC
ncbi:hypothetical protein NLJ89_g6640 [Agrocybe chaxingu]|uniref:C2H2-type domain-containing protein n=1 Tax=Agrocybe chaxingu TaxID=84603 RepID=A0A9W8MSH7_9AGAR|nr:hypothetical protein NLJ89_g6640 [Agrocybe chaxingu]